MNRSDSIAELAAALAEARKTFEPILRTKTVKVTSKSGASYTFKYAPLEDIIAATEMALANNGLSVIQGVAEKGFTLTSTLVHASGQWLEVESPLLLPPEATNQAMGGALSYARRYGYTLLLCLAADDDDDANSADGNQAEVVAYKPRQASQAATGAKGVRLGVAGRNWFMVALKKGIEAELDLGIDPSMLSDALKDTMRGQLVQSAVLNKMLGRAASNPVTEEEWKLAATNLTELRSGNLQI